MTAPTTAVDLQQAAHLAVDIAREAGDTAVAAWDRDVVVQGKGTAADLVTEVDLACETRLIKRIMATYPTHGILAEEHGAVGEASSAYQWHLDPLDGTHNYVLGLPSFGVCVTLCHQGSPVVAVVHDSIRRHTTWAVTGGGTHLQRGDAAPAQVNLADRTAVTAEELRHCTLSWVQGYLITHDDAFAIGALECLRTPTKRVLQTWSPSVDWGLVARGQIAAIVLYANQIHDLIGGPLLVRQAGGAVLHEVERDVVVAGRPGVVRWVADRLALRIDGDAAADVLPLSP